MIKKLLSIAAAAAMFSACVSSLAPDTLQEDRELAGYEHDGKVTFTFAPDFGTDGPSTKAMVEGADIKSLHVAVFDASGFKLSEYVKAEPYTTGPDNDTDYRYSVELKVSTKKRIVHIIANGPDELRFGSEFEVIGELTTAYNADETADGVYQNAYWQRLEFEKITAKPEADDPDFETKKAEYEEVLNTLNGVKLIRNYSKVSVKVDTEKCNNFTLTGFWFVNYPDKGSVAPYNRNTGTFVNNYVEYETVADLEDPEKGNYQGFMLASTNFITLELVPDNRHDVVGGVASGYVYEREKALISPMYLIIQGNYNGSANPSFYKVAMQNNNGDFYAMLRNFNYLVEIQSVSTAGEDTAEKALAGTPSGDISVNVDYIDLPNISDGDARLTVSETTLYLIAEKGKKDTVDFWYKYEPDITQNVSKNGTDDSAAQFVSLDYETNFGSTGAVIESLAMGTDDALGRRKVTIHSTAVGDVQKTQTITVVGHKNYDSNTGKYQTITRMINLVLRDTLAMKVTASPNTDGDGDAHIKSGVGQKAVVNIAVEDGIPSSMFPMVFKIEPVQRTITPDNDKSAEQELPARSGVGHDGRPAYWFEKTVTWADYSAADVVDGKRVLYAYFSTILADSETTLFVSQEYCGTPQTVKIENYVASEFRNLAFSGTSHKVGEQETFSFDMSTSDGTPSLPDGGKVTVAMKGIEPASGSGLTFKSMEDGWEIYEMTVSSSHASFGVIPFAAGQAEIKLSAYLFDDASKTVTVLDGNLPVGTVIFNDTFGTKNYDIDSYEGAGVISEYNKKGVTYSLSGTKTNISTTGSTNMDEGHVRFTSSTRNESNTITLSGIAPYGAKKVTLSFSAYISNTSRVSGTSSVNGSTPEAITSGANSYEVTLAEGLDSIEIKFVITHANTVLSGTLGIDNVKLTITE